MGNLNEKILVECKSHTWTESGNVPSAKMTTWDQAMYLFYAAPTGYRKISFVLKDYSLKRQETLVEYYIRTKSHLIPNDVEICEFDEADFSRLIAAILPKHHIPCPDQLLSFRYRSFPTFSSTAFRIFPLRMSCLIVSISVDRIRSLSRWDTASLMTL